ncbi:alpha/beta fold hydrolase [Actinomycetospora sp. TBRC 11914]|uniref:alpha/beta fold hydrolase n=1 Tax=Actinomycetospora sp. TBRC 11914 TaxID=2729387 RepID=UPI00145F56D9|nr:alpha/beta fold hydrolase [Actinomycetospora sp. TBRC 11914]NMO91643.1 alpha/beta fold hydrolase [Actinomycetospora sp. TBRC 11914]
MATAAEFAENPGGHASDLVIADRSVRYVDVGSGPALLLVHGLGGSWQTWMENIPTLARRYRVIALDLPGFGRSEPLAPPATTDGFVDVIDNLLRELGITEAVVAGHSLGGLVATLVAERRPARTRGLILVSAGSVTLSRARLAMIGVGFGLFDAVVRRTPLLDLVANHTRLRWAFLRGAVQRPATLAPALAREVIPAMQAPGFADAVTSGVEVVRQAEPVRVRCPTTLIWGRDDHLVPLSSAHLLRRALPGAHLSVLEDVGHCSMFEWPEVFNQIVLDFMSELDDGTARAPHRAPDGVDPVAWYTRPRQTGLVRAVVRLGRRGRRHLVELVTRPSLPGATAEGRRLSHEPHQEIA